MPTYEYACKDCGEHLDVFQSFSDDALTECPNCGGNLRKVFSAAGIIFKGSGWHIKDYAKSGSSNSGNGSNGSSEGSDREGAADGGSSSDASGATSSDASTSSDSSKSSDASKSSKSSSGEGGGGSTSAETA